MMSASIFEENKTTLKESSKDKANNEYMAESELEIVDFDKVMKQYCKNLGLDETPKSCDALYSKDNKVYFIEFKNGKIEPKDIYEIKKKIYDSIFIYSDLTEHRISEIRKTARFILVYNESRNPSSIQNSHSYNKLADTISKKAKEELKHFRFSGLENYILEKVHTYTEREFEEFLRKLI